MQIMIGELSAGCKNNKIMGQQPRAQIVIQHDAKNVNLIEHELVLLLLGLKCIVIIITREAPSASEMNENYCRRCSGSTFDQL